MIATPPGGTFQQVSAGWSHTCGVKTDGEVACWGHDEYGQATPPGGTFRQVSAGGNYTCGLRTDSEVLCWGNDDYQQATPPGGTFRQVSAGGFHTCGLRTDGGVACWGYDDYGQATPPEGTFRQISAGVTHTCGVKTDGELACWGQDDDGQATPPGATFRQVSAGGHHTCALKTDGGVACWGHDWSGTGTPPDATFQQVSAGGWHACGLKTDGGVVCWGFEARGSVVVDGDQQQSGVDYDADDDGLIEVSNLAQLYAVRHDLDGDGAAADEASRVAYYAAFPDAPADMGCPADGCVGYELVADLDFDANYSGMVDAGDAYWNDGAGWMPIGVDTDQSGSSEYYPFNALFDGNGHTIANLYINRKGSRHPHGLFGATGAGSRVRNVALTLVDLAAGSSAGGLVGSNRSIIEKGYVMGVVTGEDRVGGLVGYNRGGIIIDSYASVAVAGTSEFGGLVGSSNGIIAASYAFGDVYGSDPAPPVVAADELPRPSTVHRYSWVVGWWDPTPAW